MFRTEDLGISVREPFVGIVVEANYPCECEVCEKGTQRLIEMGRELRTTKRVHIVIKPLEKYDKFQHAWYNESKLVWSGIGAFTISLNEFIGFKPSGKTPEEQWVEVKKFIEGKVFEWVSVSPMEFVLNYLIGKAKDDSERAKIAAVAKRLPAGLKEARSTWIPKRLVNEKELQFFGITVPVSELHKKAIEEWRSAAPAEEVDVEEYDVKKILGF